MSYDELSNLKHLHLKYLNARCMKISACSNVSYIATHHPFHLYTIEFTDPCSDIFCGNKAKCVYGRCECEVGFSGDPYFECTDGKKARLG